MNTNVKLLAGGLLAALLVKAWAWPGSPGPTSDHAQIMWAFGLAVLLILVGIRQSKRHSGRVDPFHPLVFPLAYVALSFLAPIWVTFVSGNPVGALALSTALSPNTSALLGLGVAGFAAGAFIRFQPRRCVAEAGNDRAGRLLGLGRLILIVPLALALRDYTQDTVLTRGLGQTDYTMLDSLRALLSVTSFAAVLLILAAHQLTKRRYLLAKLDWSLILLLIAALGGSGRRGDAITIMLAIMIAHVWRRGRIRYVITGTAVVALFALTVLTYRSTALGRRTEVGAVDALLGDMAVAAYTTGATAAVVSDSTGYENGGTIVAGLIRQLPGPISARLFGPPTDTGAYKFRETIGYTNPNGGLAFSIPAEGYLNFGPPGIFALCGLIGLLASWAYSRASFTSCRATGLFYPLLVASLPFGLRSDVLGFTKGLLYPMIIIAVAMELAATGCRRAQAPVNHATTSCPPRDHKRLAGGLHR